MSLSFSHPWGIVGIVGAAAVLGILAWALAMTRRRSVRWRVVSLILPALAGVAIAGAVARPILKYETRAANVVILLDLSGSTRASPWRDPRWVRALAQRRLKGETTVSVVGFAETARMLIDHVALGDDARWPTVWPAADPDNASDVDGALAWRSSEEAQDGEPVAPRWLITDGLATLRGEDAAMPFAVTEIPPLSAQPDLGVVNVQRMASGELNIQVRATGPATGRLKVRRDGKPFVSEMLAFSELGGSTRWVTLHDADAVGAPRYEAVITRLPTADPWPENDRASVQWSPASAPRVLVVSGEAEKISSAVRALDPEIMPPSAFPSDLRDLLAANRQVVVLDAGVTLSTLQLATLDAFVQDTGGGLLLDEVVHPEEDAFSSLSPVFNAAPDRAAARIVFLLDASGSMNESAGPAMPDQKFRLASRGVMGAIELLHAEDQLAVLAFNGGVQRIGVGTKQELGTSLEEQLLRVQPTGPTSPDVALPEISSAFTNQTADAPAMVVLLTDGEIPSMDVARWEAVLRSAGASLAIIAPRSSHADSLAALAAAVHATWYSTEDATRWPLLLRRAVSERFAGRERTDPLEWQSENLEGAALRGKSARWREVWRKPEALDLARAGTTTLAALAQHGLGRVAALAMKDSSAAGEALVQRVVQRIAPPEGDRRITLSSAHDRDHWKITADAVENGEFLNGLQLHATVVTAEATLDVPLVVTGPGHYEARVESAHPFEAIVAERMEKGEHFVGTLRMPQMEIGEWPASVDAGSLMKIPAAAKVIGTGDSGGAWSARVPRATMALAFPLWITGILLLLASLRVGQSR
jgi:von Willebrand factor type A domain